METPSSYFENLLAPAGHSPEYDIPLNPVTYTSEILELICIGSFRNGTNISAYSTPDYLIRIPHSSFFHDSTLALHQLRSRMLNRIQGTITISEKSLALTSPSGQALLIPAVHLAERRQDSDVFAVPGVLGTWRYSSPNAHATYLDESDKLTQGEIKPLIRLVKTWKYRRHVPLSSFYLEIFVCTMNGKWTGGSYSERLCTLLSQLAVADLHSVDDPSGISGEVSPCDSEILLKEAMLRLHTATLQAEKAWKAEQQGHMGEALQWWSLVFNEAPAG
jgi:hypothetical protein